MNAKNKNDVELESLCGRHLLTGVDRCSKRIKDWGSRYEDCGVLNFTLDGKTYTACEDPADGYRSCMRYLRVTLRPTKNVFPPVRVTGRMRADCPENSKTNDVLELVDDLTGKVVLAVGTDNTDDYYPWWVAEFSPENMACNQSPALLAPI